LLGQICFRFLFSLEIDRRAVIGRADSAGEECPVIARIVPGEPARIITVVPKGDSVLDRLHRFLAVERDRLPSASTPLPPHDQRKGDQKTTGSPKVWPSDWPYGRPWALSFLPTARYSSQVSGNLPSP